MNTPIITGIGHEINFTISDYVADLRAPTPTGAAERCAPDQKDVLQNLNIIYDRITKAIYRKKKILNDELNDYKNSYVFTSSQRLYSEKEIYLENLNRALNQSLKIYTTELNHELDQYSNQMTQLIKDKMTALKTTLNTNAEHLNTAVKLTSNQNKNQLIQYAKLLDAYSPLKSLTRGYAIIENKEGNSVKSANNISVGDTLTITLQDGKVVTQATEIIKEKEHA